MPADRFIHPKLGHSAKVRSLSDFAYRVWTQYLLSADDFGVMRGSAVTLQADNDALECRPPNAVERALDQIITKELVVAFEHQGRRYVFQPDWQAFQKVEYPRGTDNPKPPADALKLCDAATRELFGKHPGGQGKKKPRTSSEDSPNVPQMISEGSPPTRAGAPAKRLTLTANANGERLEAEANGSESIDVLASRLLAAYPEQGACSLHAVAAALLSEFGGRAASEFGALLDRLEGHKRSAKWTEQGGRFIPRLDRYLMSGTHKQTMPPPFAATGTHGKVAPGDAWRPEGQ